MQHHQWTFKMKGREYFVELEYQPGASVVVIVNDEIVYDDKLDRSGFATFILGGRDAAVQVKKHGFGYEYDLIVNGISYTTRKPVNVPKPTPSEPLYTSYSGYSGLYDEPEPEPELTAPTSKKKTEREYNILKESPQWASYMLIGFGVAPFSMWRGFSPDCSVGTPSTVAFFVGALLITGGLAYAGNELSRHAYIPAAFRVLGVVIIGFLNIPFLFGLVMLIVRVIGAPPGCPFL